MDSFLDLRYFRGETLITWHYRELPRVTALKYFVLARYVADRDRLGLLDRLEEDGAFGCWTFDVPRPRARTAGTCSTRSTRSASSSASWSCPAATGSRVLDVGAGYGRLAHRMATALPGLADYCCVDAVPESTFLSEYYLRHRGLLAARARGQPGRGRRRASRPASSTWR